MPDDDDRHADQDHQDQHHQDHQQDRDPGDRSARDEEEDRDQRPARGRRGRHRRDDDRRLFERLAATGFDPESQEWHTLLGVLAEYGYPVLRRWLVNGKIHQMARQQGGGVRGLPKIPPGLIVGPDDAHELAVMTLQSSLRRFLRSLAEGEWDVERGASLATFFVGRCLMAFPDVYQQWSRDRVRRNAIIDHSQELEPGRAAFGVQGSDPALEALARTERDEILARLSSHDRALLELSAAGYRAREIAGMFTRAGIPRTESAVSARLSRLRKELQRRRVQDDGSDEETHGGGDDR